MFKTGKEKVDFVLKEELCIGCGFCQFDCSTKKETKIDITFNEKQDRFIPKNTSVLKDIEADSIVCPGAEMDMKSTSSYVYKEQPKDPVLGHIQKLLVSQSKDETYLKASASGGLIPTVLDRLFETNQVDTVYCVVPGDNVYGAQGIMINSKEELKKIHGSVYHPVNYGTEILNLLKSKKRFAIVGVPCQIAGFKNILEKTPELENNLVLSIGLFCGGINSFKGINYYLNTYKESIKEIKQIFYRKGKWPGKIEVIKKDNSNRFIPRIRGNTRWRILRYVISFQGYWMLKRCRICPDQINDFADIAVGDPHLPELRKRSSWGYSAVVTRSDKGTDVINDLIRNDKITEESLSRETLAKTQGYTLDNRRHLKAYLRLNRLFGGKNPSINLYDGLNEATSFRHYVYATVDLFKVYLPKSRMIEVMYLPWQIFEYLFITFAPRVIWERLFKIIRNK